MERARRVPWVFEATGTVTGKMRNEVHGVRTASGRSWDMATDAPCDLGGEDAAVPVRAEVARRGGYGGHSLANPSAIRHRPRLAGGGRIETGSDLN